MNVLNLQKRLKKEYFENLDTNVIKNTKTFWKSVKPHFTNKGSDSKKIILVEKDEITTDNAKIADIMNDYFINITKELNIPPPISNIKEQRVDTGIDSIDMISHVYREHPSIIKIRHKVDHTSKFSFIKIEQEQLEKEILVLNIKKAAGYDHISPKILKEAVNTVKAPLSNIFNTSLENCVFPSELKYFNVTPMFKKDDNTNKGNYRPIRILPVISKILERLMFQQMSSFVDNVISPYLCGFRKGYSTQHALLLLMHKINKSLDLKQKVGLLMMDLSKTFDCISHDLIIAKLYAYGFDKGSLKFIYSYLKGRCQRVKINTNYSSWKDILTGVPQGSVLGPLLFNIFLNDIFYFVNEKDICNYADDNTLSVADIDINNIINGLEANISILNTWFSILNTWFSILNTWFSILNTWFSILNTWFSILNTWFSILNTWFSILNTWFSILNTWFSILNTWFLNNSQKLNGGKCQFLIIESVKSLRNKNASVKVGNIKVEERQNGKHLGITIDNNNSMV